jgi:UDP-GlcNAc:undecaprenyl-phosphate GlcNAc-1-phosphate transferase
MFILSTRVGGGSLEAVATFFLALCVAVMLMPLLNWFARRVNFVDQPNARKIHTRPIPLLGGVGVYAGVILALLRSSVDRSLSLLLLASLLVMLLGVIDDRFDLHSRYRLLVQATVALGLSLSGIRFHFFPVEALDHLLTAVWVVGVINAMNCLDCADGAAGGTCVVVFGALAALAAAGGQHAACLASLAVAGAVLGFLAYNIPPARVFLGDTGSTFLGLMAAVLAILVTPRHSGYWHIPAPALLLTIPVLDIAWVHYRRYQAGIRSIRDLLASTGKDHLPHRLLARGFSKPAAMGLVVMLSALAAEGVCAWHTRLWAAVAVTVIGLVAILWYLEQGAEIVIRAEDQVALYRHKRDSAVATGRSAAGRPAPGRKPQRPQAPEPNSSEATEAARAA